MKIIKKEGNRTKKINKLTRMLSWPILSSLGKFKFFALPKLFNKSVPPLVFNFGKEIASSLFAF